MYLDHGTSAFAGLEVACWRTSGGAVMFTCLVTRVVSRNPLNIKLHQRPALLFRSWDKLCWSVQGATDKFWGLRALIVSQLQGRYLEVQPTPLLSYVRSVGKEDRSGSFHLWCHAACNVHSPNLSHEVLVTLMAEVADIMNGRPLVPVSSDPEQPDLLTPSALLTQKLDLVASPPGDFDSKVLFRKQWKQLQSFANSLWERCGEEYQYQYTNVYWYTFINYI